MKRLLLLLASCCSTAQAAHGPCAGAPRPAEPWTSWSQSGNAVAGGTVGSSPRIILGKPVTATLRPAAQVQLVVQPGHILPKSYAGLFTLAVKEPARVGIGLSADAWVDVAIGREPATPVGEERGEGCSGIRKIMWYDLPAGLHIVQIANARTHSIRVMAADAQANRPRRR